MTEQSDNAIRAQAAGHRNEMLEKYRDKIESLFRMDQIGPNKALERGLFTREQIAEIAQDAFTLLLHTLGMDVLERGSIPDGMPEPCDHKLHEVLTVGNVGNPNLHMCSGCREWYDPDAIGDPSDAEAEDDG